MIWKWIDTRASNCKFCVVCTTWLATIIKYHTDSSLHLMIRNYSFSERKNWKAILSSDSSFVRLATKHTYMYDYYDISYYWYSSDVFFFIARIWQMFFSWRVCRWNNKYNIIQIHNEISQNRILEQWQSRLNNLPTQETIAFFSLKI